MKRILVLGGGFGGLAAAQHLDRSFRDDESVEITLVSRNNFQVYTPMLADVAGGTIEPRHAIPPLRAFLKKVRFREAEVTEIDVAHQTVRGTLLDGSSAEITYDYLILTLGTVTNFSHATGAAEHCLGLKDLADAIRVRNRALTLLEWAETTRDPQLRQEQLTFVMAGGGFSGVEGIAALEDLLHGALKYYHGISQDEVRLILAPHGNRLLEEIDPRLGDYVLRKLSKRAIEVLPGVGVSAVTERTATLTNGTVIPTRTVIWTGGIMVNPVLKTADLPKDKHGAIRVINTLQVVDHPNIFALGDCAAVPTPDGQGFYAPTAQNAIRQGPVAAQNVADLIRQWPYPQKTFHYKPVGSLASLGQRQAVAQIGKIHLSGLPAFFAWRGIYLAKLPTFGAKTRVGLDWLANLFAPVDSAQAPVLKENLPAVLARLSPTTVLPSTAPSPAVPPTAPTSAKAEQPLTEPPPVGSDGAKVPS